MNAFDSNYNDIQEQSFVLGAGNQKTLKFGEFRHVFIEDASDVFTISFGSTSLVSGHKSKLFSLGGTETEITIKSLTAQTVKVQASMAPINTGRGDVTITSVNTTIQGSNAINNPGDVTVTSVAASVAAANANRKSIIFFVPSSESFGVRVGNSSVGVASGILIEPGMTREFFDESQWYAIRESAATGDVTMNVLELERP